MKLSYIDLIQVICTTKNNAGKTADNLSYYDYNKDDISLFFYLSLSKLILVLSFMNILSEFQSFDPMYVMLCCSLQFLNMFH